VNVLPTGQLGLFVPVPSSREYKHNIRSMDTDSEIIYKLRPVTFEYNDNNETAYGLIAEEVDELFPYLVQPHPQGIKKVYTVDYAKLPALLLNEIQKINKSINELQDKDLTITKLKAENQIMKDIIDKLRLQMDFVLKKMSTH
jgi:hypothetical protein